MGRGATSPTGPRLVRTGSLWVGVVASVVGVVLRLAHHLGTPRPVPGPYASGRPIETIVEVRPYLVPAAAWTVLWLGALALCVACAAFGAWIALVVEVRRGRRLPARVSPGAARGLVPGLGVGLVVAAVVCTPVVLGWLMGGPEEVRFDGPEQPTEAYVELSWGWTDPDLIVFKRSGLLMVPVRPDGG